MTKARATPVTGKNAFARLLRQRMTPTETVLWAMLRNRKFARAKFRRQVAIGPYVADFLSYQHHLIIELDGEIHASQKEYDHCRDEYLLRLGFRVLRISNEFVNNDVQSLMRTLEKEIHG